jgi:3-dehydroquinate synthase
MMPQTRLDVRSALGTYAVVIRPDLLGGMKSLLAEFDLAGDVVVVSCPPVWRAHGEVWQPVIGKAAPVIIPDGERAKTLQSVARIYDALVKRHADRSCTLVAFGGGVVGDVAGFAAATYLRGLRLVQVPTTLLAQVDSAVGGKVGVNLPTGKNLVGAFYPPKLVACDPRILDSLPRREFRAGLYEVIKYGVIASRELFGRVASSLPALFARNVDALAPLIADCCRIKADVVMEDERENGPRRALNFGHTIGHALESITKYRRFRHGEAVGYGMLAAAEIASARSLLTRDELDQLRSVIAHMGPMPPVTDLKISEAREAMLHDKKVVAGTLNFVLPTAIGATTIVGDVQPKELKAAMRAIGMR